MKKLVTIASVLALGWVAYAGSADAILRLLNSRTSGSPKAYEEAAAEVAEEARAGKLLQCFVLAVISRESDAPSAAQLNEATREEYLKLSREKIRSLAEEKDNALAWYLLSVEAGDTNLLRRAANGGNAQALNAWGTLSIGQAFSANLPTNQLTAALEAARECYNQAAGQGDANGLYNLGMCYARGIGTPVNDEKAFACFRTAAEKGHPEAINNIGSFYREGRVVKKDLELAAKWFMKSAQYRNPFGLLNYALALQRGEGVEKNPAAAVKLLEASSKRGCVEATCILGVALQRGFGVKKDEVAGAEAFQAAAQKGYPPAMENLAVCYEKGKGVSRNAKLSLEWKIRSRAARGDKNAMAWLRANGIKSL